MGSYLSKLLTIQPTYLVGAYGLLETSGTTANDSSNEANHGTYTGGVTLNNATFTDGSPMPRYDGLNDMGTLPASLGADIVSARKFTYAGWAKIVSAAEWASTAERYLVATSGNVSNEYLIIRKLQNSLYFNWRTSAGLRFLVYGFTSTDLFHIAITVDPTAGANGEAKFYVNGAQVGTTQTNVAAWTSVSASSALGAASAGGSNWNGWLSHAAFWKTALTPAEIANVYLVGGAQAAMMHYQRRRR